MHGTIGKAPRRGTRDEEAARRLANLVFSLNASRTALTTSQIISDADLGYGSDTRSSDERKFRRDRDKLEELGIFVHEVKAEGESENEESRWEIDRERTHASQAIEAEDAQAAIAAIDAVLARHETVGRDALRRARLKILESCGFAEPREQDDPSVANARADGIAQALWAAFSQHKSIKVRYRNWQGGEKDRVLSIYGFFSQDGSQYVSALDSDSGQERTFRVDRVQRTWVPSGSYAIPMGYDVHDRVFLPSDFADGEPVEAVFSLGSTMDEREAHEITRGRGELAMGDAAGDAGWIWRVPVRDLHAAAGYALSHARLGMRPRSPHALVDAWNDLIEGAVSAHER